MELHDWSFVATIIKVALEAGGRKMSPTTYEWDVSNGCETPVLMTYTGRPEAEEGEKYVHIGRGRRHTLTLEMWVACRKCHRCVKRRARMWTMRAASEVTQAERTWFVTLTLSPESLYRCEAIANNADVMYHQRTQDEQERARFDVIVKEIQRFLKRVRKNSKAKLRYICVQELHKSGNPHYHLLIHEVHGTLLKRVVQDAWTLGFSQCKLADPRTAIYVCKYLNKAQGARVRASLGYGQGRTVSNHSEA
nr:MAG: replication initiator protein [Microvirus sp.]